MCSSDDDDEAFAVDLHAGTNMMICAKQRFGGNIIAHYGPDNHQPKAANAESKFLVLHNNNNNLPLGQIQLFISFL